MSEQFWMHITDQVVNSFGLFFVVQSLKEGVMFCAKLMNDK